MNYKKIKHFIPTLLILDAPVALAVDVNWNGSVDSNWNMPGNWSTGLVPGTVAQKERTYTIDCTIGIYVSEF